MLLLDVTQWTAIHNEMRLATSGQNLPLAGPLRFFESAFHCGAESGVRSRSLDLGKVALCQLSYFRAAPPTLANVVRDTCQYRRSKTFPNC